MRRISVFLAAAAVLIVVVVGYTYQLRLQAARALHPRPTPQIQPAYEAIANRGWSYGKDDPKTNKPIVRISAKSFEAAHDPSSVALRDVRLRLYDKAGEKYTFVHSESASFEDSSNLMKSHGAVRIVMDVPSDKDAENPADVGKLVQVQTSGVRYNTQTGSAETDQPAAFHFPAGDGAATGVSYDPSSRTLLLKQNATLDWLGNGPAVHKMHIEAGNLRYMEREHKIYLSPWSKMVRGGTAIEAKDSVVTLDADGTLQRVDAREANGVDVRQEDASASGTAAGGISKAASVAKQTHFKANAVTATFDPDGVMRQIIATGNANVISEQPASRTTLTGDRAEMLFDVTHSTVNGNATDESTLKSVIADGHAVAEASPVPQTGATLPETRILRSEHIELAMNPDGKTIREMRSPVRSELEFRPNNSGQPHRVIDASSLRAVYGDDSYIQSFEAVNAVTHTDRLHAAKPGAAPAISKAMTSSDRLVASFESGSNRVSTIQQNGHFHYEEDKRKANAQQASLDERDNKITLIGKANVSDDTGSTSAERILMNQTTGDMDAFDHVLSIRLPEANQKPGTSMLDATRAMQAKADQMTSRGDNTDLVYTGHAEMWQGPNRITAKRIEVNRDNNTLVAKGDVVSELVDNSKSQDANAAPLFTIVRAPELTYRDDDRLADYSGGVKLTRASMTVTSKELKAYLTPKSASAPQPGAPAGDSSLDHAFADGAVVVTTLGSGAPRKGTGEHCEYYAKLDKVILNGGNPQLEDSRKGITRGRQLTYFNDDDRLIVEGQKNQLAYTQMKKGN